MGQDEFEQTCRIVSGIKQHNDINYLQTLVFDWREKKQAVSKKRVVWGTAALFSWISSLIIFCVFSWANDVNLLPTWTLLSIWFATIGLSIMFSSKRSSYTKIYKRYEILIEDAMEFIRRL